MSMRYGGPLFFPRSPTPRIHNSGASGWDGGTRFLGRRMGDICCRVESPCGLYLELWATVPGGDGAAAIELSVCNGFFRHGLFSAGVNA